MPKKSDTRQVLLKAGQKAFVSHGYDGVGISTILMAAGVPKGSFYHFFESKEEFAEAVLDDYERYFIAFRKRFFEDAAEPPMRRVRRYFDELERMHRAEVPLGGCLFGVMAATVSIRSPGFRERLARIFSTWTDQLETLLVEAREAGEIRASIDVKAAAAFLIEAYQGALVRMKVEGSPDAFDRFRQYALASICLAEA